jgi:hypothetical protein
MRVCKFLLVGAGKKKRIPRDDVWAAGDVDQHTAQILWRLSCCLNAAFGKADPLPKHGRSKNHGQKRKKWKLARHSKYQVKFL